MRPINVSVKVSTLDSIRFELKDENLNSVDFNSNDLHCVLHFKKVGYYTPLRLPAAEMDSVRLGSRQMVSALAGC